MIDEVILDLVMYMKLSAFRMSKYNLKIRCKREKQFKTNSKIYKYNVLNNISRVNYKQLPLKKWFQIS